jgi:hypothetical protein
MPVTRSSTRPTVSSVATPYNLRTGRPAAGFYAEKVDEEMHAAATTLLSLCNATATAAPIRRSARIASRS